MSALKPVTATANGSHGGFFALRMRTPGQQSSWKQVFNPFVLGLIGLSIAVAFWGFGYKLSLYHRHSTHSSQASVAKLWIVRRDARVAAAYGLKDPSRLFHVSRVFRDPTHRLPRPERAVACTLRVCRRGVEYFDFLIPFRSPPAHHFRLA